MTEIDCALTGLKPQRSGEITVNGVSYVVEIRANLTGYEGFVDNTNFGGGKTVRAAVGAIKRRLLFLATAASHTKTGLADLEASRINKELIRREKTKW